MNEPNRSQLVKERARRILSKAWRIDGLWTTRLEVHGPSAELRANAQPLEQSPLRAWLAAK